MKELPFDRSNMENQQEHLRRLGDVANRLGCGVTTVRSFIREGRLRVVRVAGAMRVPDSAIDELIAELQRSTPSEEARSAGKPQHERPPVSVAK